MAVSFCGRVQSLLQRAQRGRFDIVLAEALDRVSCDQIDVATLFKHLRFAGVQIVTLAEGEISEGAGAVSNYKGSPIVLDAIRYDGKFETIKCYRKRHQDGPCEPF